MVEFMMLAAEKVAYQLRVVRKAVADYVGDDRHAGFLIVSIG